MSIYAAGGATAAVVEMRSNKLMMIDSPTGPLLADQSIPIVSRAPPSSSVNDVAFASAQTL